MSVAISFAAAMESQVSSACTVYSVPSQLVLAPVVVGAAVVDGFV